MPKTAACLTLTGIFPSQQEAITEQRFPEYARNMVACAYPNGDVPEWITLGLELAGITL
jgi:hypothetical protein